MIKLVFIIGVICLVAGLVPLPIDDQVTKPLRIHDVVHMTCDNNTCEVVNKEMGL